MKSQKLIPTELEEQVMTAQYLAWLGLCFNHSPNEGQRTAYQGAMLKRMGMRKGFPDFFIYEPRGQYHGLAIEMKRVKGGKLSDDQRQCLEDLVKRGYYACVCKGYDEAKETIDEYLKLKENSNGKTP